MSLPRQDRKEPDSKSRVLVVRGGIDPPTSGFSDPYGMFRYVSVHLNGLRFKGFVRRTGMY